MSQLCNAPQCKNKFKPKVHNQKYCSLQCKRDVENVVRRRPIHEFEDLAVDPPEEDILTYLRAVNLRLARENARLKVEKFEVKDLIEHMVSEGLHFDPVKQPKKDNRTGVKLTAAAVLSDWQVGKKTPNFDVFVAEQRLNSYLDKAFRLTDLHRSEAPMREFKLWALGDMVEGEGIFPGQQHYLDADLYNQVVIHTPRLLVNIIRRALQYFDTVNFYGISGNHGAIGGRARSDYHPTSNADRMVYGIVQQIMADESRITWEIPQETYEGDFYAIDHIGDKSVLLTHGHQINGIGTQASIGRRVKDWATGAIPEHFDYVVMGHFHNATRFTFNDIITYINGTLESSNGWARKLGHSGRPCQYFMIFNQENGVEAEYPIYLDV